MTPRLHPPAPGLRRIQCHSTQPFRRTRPCAASRNPSSRSRATHIFARPAKDGGQYLVYSMILKAKDDLAMILPIPTPKAPKEDAVKFINLEKYPDFFNDMRTGFPEPRAARGQEGRRAPAAGRPAKLKVVEVGSFDASFVPTVKDFARLDEQFRLPDGTWDKLPAYKDYGFAVFKLKKGEQKVHPMAFEFPRADKNEAVLPHRPHPRRQGPRPATFDHALYCQGADTADAVGGIAPAGRDVPEEARPGQGHRGRQGPRVPRTSWSASSRMKTPGSDHCWSPTQGAFRRDSKLLGVLHSPLRTARMGFGCPRRVARPFPPPGETHDTQTDVRIGDRGRDRSDGGLQGGPLNETGRRPEGPIRQAAGV